MNMLVQRPDMVPVNAIKMNYLKMTGPYTTDNTLSWRLNKSALLQVTVIGAMLQGIQTGLNSVTPAFTPIKTAINTGVTSLTTLKDNMQKMYDNLG